MANTPNDPFETIKDEDLGLPVEVIDPEAEKKDLEQRRKKETRKEIWSWVRTIAIAVAIAIILRLFVVEFIRVDGRSMEPTLVNDQHVLVWKVGYYFGMPGRYDIVICHYPNHGEELFVKRVMALPGESVAVRDGSVWVNGEKLTDDPVGEIIRYQMDEIIVPEGSVFVMGDNRNDSHDSHSMDIGPIQKGAIVGQAVAVAWPLNDWRILWH